MSLLQKNKPLTWFLIALTVFLAAGTVWLVLQMRRGLLDQMREHADREMHLLGAMIEHDLVRHNYVSVREYIDEFGSQYEDIASITVKAHNGFLIGHYRRFGPNRHPFIRNYCAEIGGMDQGCVDIEIVLDIEHIHAHLRTMIRRAMLGLLLFAAAMGSLLWAILRKTAFQPLERAIADLNAANETLEYRVAQRTADWVMANKDLKQEILERETTEKELLIKDRAISSSVNGIALGGLDGRLTYVNGAFLGMWGYAAADQVLGRLATEFWESQDDPRKVLEAVLDTGKWIGEMPARRQDGSVFYVQLTAETVLDENGTPICLMGSFMDITEHKRAEQLLRESDAKYRLVLDNINEIIYLISLRPGELIGSVNFVGGQTSTIVGCEAEAFIRDSRLWYSMVHEDDRAALIDSTERMVRDRKRVTRTYRVLNQETGRLVWLEDKVTPQLDGAGTIIGYFGVARDITKRKQAEDELRRSNDTQTVINRLLSISMEDLTLDEVLHRALNVILFSARYSHHPVGAILLMDGEKKQLVMRVQQGLSAGVQETCAVVPLGACLCGRAAATQEVQFADRCGEQHEVRYADIAPHGHYCVPITVSGRTLGVISLYLDEGHQHDDQEQEFLTTMARSLAGVIERKRMEDERERLIVDLRTLLNTISASRREWHETFDSIKDMISIHGEDYTIIRANRAFAENFGMDPREVIGKKCYDLFHRTASPVHQCPHHRTIDRQEPATEEINDPASGRIFLISTFPYASPESKQRGIIHIARDITDMKEKEMRLIMSERLASLGQMASGVAHEINNPLAAIVGCVDGMNRRIARGEYDSELFRKYLGIIKEEIARSKNITTSMLSVVRKSSYEKKRLSITDVLEKSLEIMEIQGRLKQIEVRKIYGNDLPAVHGSEGELKQVFLIVLSNALDAMEDKGTLTLSTAYQEQRLYVDISDTGPGIPQDLRMRIFDPFFTTKSERGGTGLGLSIAARIMAGQNGAISVLADERPGATIRIILPLA